MDQLKQVLKFQFWILLGVALILPFVGWSMATSGLVTEAAARTDELTKLDGSLKVDANDPNKEWETGLEEINKLQAVQPRAAHKVLYERQLPLMTWPAKMPSDLTKFQNVHGEYYRTAYRQLVEEVRKIVKPYDEETQTGLVTYPEELLPTPDSEWVSQAPSVKQVEAAQEDLWLLSSLLKQIASVNEDEEAKTQYEAPIRQIVELYLRGGSSAKGGGASKSGSSGGGGAGAGGMGAGMEKSMAGINKSSSMAGGGGMGGMGGGTAGSSGSTAIASAKINPDDDLGAEQPAAGDKPAASDSKAGAGGGALKISAMPAGAGSGGGGMGGGGGGSGSSSRWGGSNMGRYRDDKPEYKTRGFYLEVVMDHRRIPDLLVALANADWPINVLHVQESDYKDEDLLEGGGGGGVGGMGSRSMGSGSMGPGAGGRMGGGAPPGMAGGGAPPGMKSAPLPSKGNVRSTEDSEGPVNTRSPLDDPNLANVAIVGVIYIFKKPDDKPGATSPVPSAAPSGAPATAPVAAAPAATPVATAGDAAQTPPASAEAGTDTAADDAKAEQPAPAAAAPENKPANESDKGAAPVKDGAPGKAAPENPGAEKLDTEKPGTEKPGKS